MIVYHELSTLERELGVPARELYALSNNLSHHYRSQKLEKRNGELRQLYIPDAPLKDVQRRIAQRLLAYMPVSAYATAYRYGASTLRNAAPHVKKPLVLKLDIRHFFDSVRYSDVKRFAFPEQMYAEPLRVLLAMLCYYRESLPQGAPSSPAISNLILREFDDVVGSWCQTRRICYTRYCDDLCFSGSFEPQEVIGFVSGELQKRGFFLNGQKTKTACSAQRQCITGLIVNERPNAPAPYRRAVRQELYYCRKFGVSEHLLRIGSDAPEAVYLQRLLGKVNYLLLLTANDAQLRSDRQWLCGELHKKQRPE